MHAKKRSRPSVDELVSQYRDEVTAPAAEILKHIYATLLATPEFRLADGRSAKVEAYYPPEADDDDKMHCGIDVRLSDGTQLEFTLANTGWEKSFLHELQERREHDKRTR
jgi:hypothetical protein